MKRILGNEKTAEASNLPDTMHSDSAPFWQREAGPFHYVTVPPDKVYADAEHPP